LERLHLTSRGIIDCRSFLLKLNILKVGTTTVGILIGARLGRNLSHETNLLSRNREWVTTCSKCKKDKTKDVKAV
jgi:hypothetical protein